ncbi:MAG: hypothetical protein WCD85_21275 [Pantoea agglomerans]
MSRYIERAPTDPAGLKTGVSLPYNLQSRDVLRMVEDLHDLLHEVNSMMVAKGFDRMEELLDPAGFSGFISRTIVERLDRLSRALVRNDFHNGYPDLLPYGVYPSDSVQHGERGGLEVKASRNPASWESHGPRGGWFCIVQFAIDEDKSKALKDREPTAVLAVMIERLEKGDWKWQPAKEGKIRSGTASIRPAGAAKLRANAAWVDPSYQSAHDERLITARRDAWRSDSSEDDCLEILLNAGEPMKPAEVAEVVAQKILVPADRIRSTTESTLKKLVKAGTISKPKPGSYAA